ncbi:MAG: DNA translocase FtsK 4TM domain-containing protein [Bacteroidia bacterium]
MASKGNKIKETSDSPKKKTTFRGRIASIINFFKDDRTHRITGLFLILFSAFLLIAFTSFFFTWKADHDKVTGPVWSLLTNADIKVENWLGKTGALISHQFIQNWFGIASFSFIVILTVLGCRILFGIQLLPIRKTLAYSLFALVFLSTALGFIFTSSQLLFLGGSFGFEMNKWLNGLLGGIGTGLALLFAFTGFLIGAFNLKLKFNSEKIASEETEIDPLLTAEITGNKFKEPVEENLDVKTPDMNEPIVLSIENNEDEISEEHGSVEELESINTDESEDENEMEIEMPGLETLSASEDVPLSIESAKEEPAINFTDTEETSQQLVEALGEYDPTLDLHSYQFPHLDLLEAYSAKAVQSREELIAELEANKNRIVETLGHYNISIEKIKATVGPTVTLFEIVPQAGIRISKIKNLEDDIALSLSALGIRIIAPIPGKGTIGIEVPNQNPEVVSMRTVLSSEKFMNSELDLPVGLGKTISNEVYVADLAKMPHLLMAGATGQGKSVGLNAVLVSLLYKKHPSQVKFVLVDPKKVELNLFKTIERHFLAKLPGEEDAIITDTRKVVNTLNSLCIEMDQRYELLKDAQVRNIREYNAKFVSRKLNPNNGHRFLPFIILVIDEFADLIMTAGKEIEAPITRLAQLARAIGIHLIIATQRPSVNIITGTIKANFPARIAFRVTSKIDSRTILDTGGADQLIGRGDMLLSTGADLIRLQCAFVDLPEVEKITEFIGSQRGYPDAFLLPEYVGENENAGVNDVDAADRDPLFEEAARMVVQHQQGSASLLQRRLKLGYNRAGRLIDQLEAAGIIGPFEGSKAREVRVKDIMALEQYFTVQP